MANSWYESLGGGPPVLREALEGFVSVYGEHSAELRALADAATDDPEVEAAYGALIQTFVNVDAEHIAQEARAGTSAARRGGDRKALVWMTERYLYHAFGPTGGAARRGAGDAVATIWTRALYGDRSPGSSSQRRPRRRRRRPRRAGDAPPGSSPRAQRGDEVGRVRERRCRAATAWRCRRRLARRARRRRSTTSRAPRPTPDPGAGGRLVLADPAAA